LGAGQSAAFMPDACRARAAAYEVFRLIDRTSSIDALSRTTQRDLGDGDISFHDVRFVYPSRPDVKVLRSLVLKISKGSSVAFVGPSGCGKSTVFQLTQRFYDPCSGDVKVGGVNLINFDISWWRRQIGFVGQEPVLFDMSLEDNLKYAKPDATREEVEIAAKKANMMEFVGLGKMTWEDGVGKGGHKLSGGQKQRCAIARALIRNPLYLMLDEATSALDSASESMVQVALEESMQGRTTMTIAHRLSTIAKSDDIFVFRGGRVVENGTHEDLRSKPTGVYKNLSRCSTGLKRSGSASSLLG